MTAENTRSKARRGAGQPMPEPVTPCDTVESHERAILNALITKQVLHVLGEPRNLLKVQVWPLWDGYYRVNVLVGEDPSCFKIVHSYFLETDGEGNIVDSTPKLGRPG